MKFFLILEPNNGHRGETGGIDQKAQIELDHPDRVRPTNERTVGTGRINHKWPYLAVFLFYCYFYHLLMNKFITMIDHPETSSIVGKNTCDTHWFLLCGVIGCVRQVIVIY